MRTKRIGSLAGVIVGAIAGCGGDDPATVPGEARATLQVAVDQPLSPSPSSDPGTAAERLVVVWRTYSDGAACADGAPCYEVSPAEVVADGAGYRLEVDTPPSEESLAGAGVLLSDPTSVRVLSGIIAVVDGGVDLRSIDHRAIRGIAPRHVVVFAEDDVPEGSFAGALVNAPLGRGFHLIEVSFPAYDADAAVADDSDPDPGWECFVPLGACWGGLHMEPAPDGFSTRARVTPIDLSLPFEAQSADAREAIAVSFLPFL